MLYPLHIATRGRLGGEYGIATRGYIILPDIVPRFPSGADVEESDDGAFAVISERDLEAILGDYPRLTFEASIKESDWLTVTVDGDLYDLKADTNDIGMKAEVVALADLVGGSCLSGPDAVVSVTDSDIGGVSEEDEHATVDDGDDPPVGDVGDGDPTGCG